MGWWVYLENAETGAVLDVALHSEGGTRALGGTTEASVSVTWNYSPYFSLSFPGGLRWMNDKAAADTIAHLESAVASLGTVQDADYWKATPGNAGYILSVLLGWAKQHPNGVWRVH